jgi:hypothetical protein
VPTPAQQSRIYAIARQYAEDTGREVLLRSEVESKPYAKELLGDPGEANFTPVEYRDVAPGHLLVEWIGMRGPGASEQIRAAMRIPNFLPPKLVAILERMKKITSTRIEGVSTRTVMPAEGFSRVITWGPRPGSYVQEITYADADRLFSSLHAHEFRYYENNDVINFGETEAQLIERVLPPDLANKVKSINVRIGKPEPLVGVVATDPRRGYYEG